MSFAAKQETMKFIYSLLAFVILNTVAFAGNIKGRIADEATGEGIIGATVAIKGTGNGTITDVDGNFELSAPNGSYNIEVKYLGYETKEIPNVTFNSDEVMTLNVQLSSAKENQLQEVVVRASLDKQQINSLYSIQKNAASISDGISADVIRKSPDRSTGEVLKRVSGTTIRDNKFVTIRGLSDRYNIALIDNATLPSTEPNRKAFSFDIIPSSMIDNIIVVKAATPDLPGDFAGGIINILTREVPEKNFYSIALGTSYNTVATGKTFQSGYRTKTDFLGFDDGSRQLPAAFPSGSSITGGLSKQENIAAIKSLNNDFTVRTHKALPGLSLQASLGRVYRMKGGNKFGFTGAVTYGHHENTKQGILRQYDGYNYKDNVYGYATNLGLLWNGGYYFGGNKIVFKTIYNRLLDDNFLYREGSNNSNSSDVRYYAFDLVQKSLLKTSLQGEHQTGAGQGKLGWLLSGNLVSNDQPDQRKVSYSNSGNGFIADNTTLGKANNRMFGNLKETIVNGSVDYTVPLKFLGRPGNIKLGVLEQYRYRDFYSRYIGTVINSSVAADVQDEIRRRPIASLYSMDLIEDGIYKIEEITNPADKYNATVTTSAAFVMMDNKLFDKLRIVWGSRFESYALKLRAGDGTTVSPVWNELLPSANITYSLSSESNIRASYFRSVARPELREVSTLAYYDYELNAVIKGNPSLQPARVDNIDLRYEMYPGKGEVLSASVFYKGFHNTIENYVNGQNSGFEINPSNYRAAKNIGVELELRKNLGFIANSSIFNRLSCYANVAYIHSVVALDSFDFANGRRYTERPLSGQSPYVINASLSYSSLNEKLGMNILYNRIGQRIFLVGQGRFGHVYESARNLLDFQFSYKITKQSELRFNIRDIVNNPVRMFFDQDNNGKYNNPDATAENINSDQDWIYAEYRPGTTFSLSYSYHF